MSPESFKELRLTLEANKSPLEKQPGSLLIWVTAVFWGKEQRWLSWEVAKEEPQDILETTRTSEIHPNLQVLQVNPDGNYEAWLPSLEMLIKVQSGDSL